MYKIGILSAALSISKPVTMSFVDKNSEDSTQSVVNSLHDYTNKDQRPNHYSYWKPDKNNSGITELDHNLTSVNISSSNLEYVSSNILAIPHHQVPEFHEETKVMTEINANYTANSQTCKSQSIAPSSLDYQVSDLHSELESLIEAMSPDYHVDNVNGETQNFQQDLLPLSLNDQMFDSTPAEELSPKMIADYTNNNNLICTTNCSLTEQVQFGIPDISSTNTEFQVPSVSQTTLTHKNQSDMQDPTSPNKSANLIKDSLSELLIFKTEKLDETSIEDSNKMKDLNSKPKQVCSIPDSEKIYKDAWSLKQHLDWHTGKKNFFCAHCHKGFEHKNHLTMHIQEYMDFNQCTPKNDNVSSKVLECYQENDILDFEVSKCSPVPEALAEESTNYSKDSFENTKNCSSMEQKRVSIKDLLLPLLSTSQASPTCETKYYVQDLLAELQPCHSSKDSINDLSTVEEEKNCKAKGKSKMIDNGIPRYVSSIPNCKKVYRHTGHFKTPIEWQSGKKNFFCVYCGKGFIRKSTLTCHVQLMHKCEYKKLENSVNGSNGTRESCDNPKNVCNVINHGKLFSSVPTLKTHLKKHSDNKNFFCTYCNKEFELVVDLSKHLKEHINSKQDKLQVINLNSRASQNSPIFELQTPQKSSPTKLQRLNDKDADKTMDLDRKLQHICHISDCGKVFMSAGNLKRHLDWHSGKKNFVCVHCSEGFHSKNYLVRHLRACKSGERQKSRGENSNKSSVFNKACDRSSHLVSHSVIQDLICIYCDKGFASKNLLDCHAETHFTDNQKELESNNIGTRVLRSSTILKKDISQEHQRTKYQTRSADSGNKKSSCDSTLQQISHVNDPSRILNLIPNLKKDASNKNFFCGYCDLKFKLISDFRKHVQKHVNLKHSGPRMGDNIGDSFKSEILPSVYDLVSPPLDYQDSEGRLEMKAAVPDMRTDDSKKLDKNSLDCIETRSSTGEVRVSIRDLLSPLLSNMKSYSSLFSPSEILSTPETRNCEQKSPTAFESVHLSNPANDMLANKGENTENRKSSSCSDDDSNKMRISGSKPRYVCPTRGCRRVYKHAGHFKAHVDSHNDEHLFCAHCDKGFRHRVQLIRHVKEHTSIKQSIPKNDNIDGGNKNRDLEGKPRRPRRINDCERVSNVVSSVQMLLKTYNGNKRFFCGYCSKKFALITDLRKHVKVHRSSKQKKLERKIINSHVPQSISLPETQVPKMLGRTFCQCPNCSAEDGIKTRGPDGKLIHSCNIADCRRVFTRTNNLKDHLETHKDKNGEAKYVCHFTNCGKVFGHSYGLTRHLKLHNVIKDFVWS